MKKYKQRQKTGFINKVGASQFLWCGMFFWLFVPGLVYADVCEQLSIALRMGGQAATILLPPCMKINQIQADRMTHDERGLVAEGRVVIRLPGLGTSPLTVLASSAVVRTQKADPALADDLKHLNEMAEEERRLLDKLGVQGVPDAALKKEMTKLAVAHEPKYADLLHKYGWPGFREIGVEGARTFMRSMQHTRLVFLKQYIDRARQAVKEGDASPADLAVLEDRILSEGGQLQCYGTAVVKGADGIYRPQPIEHPDQVDVRRKEVGLDPLQEHLAAINR